MTEIRVDTLKGLGSSGIKINCPVGINTNPPINGGLNIDGHIEVVNNGAEMVTVAAESFGLNIKSENNLSSSVLQFAGSQGTKRAIIGSDNSSLFFEVGNGITGPMFKDADALTGGSMYMESKVIFNNKNTFLGSNVNFEEQVTFDYNNFPKCYGIPTQDNELVNVNTVRRWIESISSIRHWSSFGGYDNQGVKWPKRKSNNFFRRLFNWGVYSCCCGCQTAPGSANPGVYNDILEGTWLIIGFSRRQSSCSCDDIEQYHWPVGWHNTWEITNNSIKNTISANLGGSIDFFGFAIKKY